VRRRPAKSFPRNRRSARGKRSARPALTRPALESVAFSTEGSDCEIIDRAGPLRWILACAEFAGIFSGDHFTPNHEPADLPESVLSFFNSLRSHFRVVRRS
jgi:hypothetical protein